MTSRHAANGRIWLLDTPVGLAAMFAAGLIVRVALAPHFGFYGDLQLFQGWTTTLSQVGTHKFYAPGRLRRLPAGLPLCALGDREDLVVAELPAAQAAGDRRRPRSRLDRRHARRAARARLAARAAPGSRARRRRRGAVQPGAHRPERRLGPGRRGARDVRALDAAPALHRPAVAEARDRGAPDLRRRDRDEAAGGLRPAGDAVCALPAVSAPAEPTGERLRRRAQHRHLRCALARRSGPSRGSPSGSARSGSCTSTARAPRSTRSRARTPSTSGAPSASGGPTSQAPTASPTRAGLELAGIPALYLGWLLFVAGTAFVLWQTHRAIERGAHEARAYMVASAAVSLLSYVVLTRMHERYMFLALVCLAPLVFVRQLRWAFGASRCSSWSTSGGCSPTSTSVARPGVPLPAHLRLALRRPRDRLVAAQGSLARGDGDRPGRRRARRPLDGERSPARRRSPLVVDAPPRRRRVPTRRPKSDADDDAAPRADRPSRRSSAPTRAQAARASTTSRWARWGPYSLVGLVCAFGLWILHSETRPAANLNDSAFHLQMVRWASDADPRGPGPARRLVPRPVARLVVLPPLPEPRRDAHRLHGGRHRHRATRPRTSGSSTCCSRSGRSRSTGRRGCSAGPAGPRRPPPRSRRCSSAPAATATSTAATPGRATASIRRSGRCGCCRSPGASPGGPSRAASAIRPPPSRSR